MNLKLKNSFFLFLPVHECELHITLELITYIFLVIDLFVSKRIIANIVELVTDYLPLGGQWIEI